MGSTTRTWLAWLLPFLISGGMAVGSLFGLFNSSSPILREGPPGDTPAGAAGALLMLLCLGVGFPLAMLTVIACKLMRREAPGSILLRLGLSVVGGGAIGALAAWGGDLRKALVWLLLLAVPALLAWSWGGKPDSGAATPAS